MMTWMPILSVILGVLTGYFLFPDALSPIVDSLSTYALLLLLFGVGLDLSQKKGIWSSAKKVGFKIFLVPIGVIIGTLIGSATAGYILKIPFNEVMAIGSGFGWYSLSGVIITRAYDIEAGTLAFMTNLARELISILSIPLLAKYLSYLGAVAPGGATTMDTTLPIISKYTKSEMTLIAFINGVILSILVPFLVNFFIQMG